ncbi:MAG: hypothetical protein GEV07_05350 [Streptosporangiales bacterium]|nr:hypothetical protein [Streptosporangiales bacterium]
MSTNVPNRKSRQNIERGLAALQIWRRQVAADYRTESDPTRRAALRRLADDLEWLCWRLEQVLHPAGPDMPIPQPR